MRTAIVSSMLFSFVVSHASASPSLSLDVSAPPSAVDIDGLNLKASLMNTGNVTLKLLNDPSSILSKARTNTFKISSGSCTPKFTGLYINYALSQAAKSGRDTAFTILAPGQTVEIDHNLAGTYDLTLCGEGSYRFIASNVFFYVDGPGELKTIKALTNPGQFVVASKLAVSSHHAKTSTIGKGDRSFIGCSADQERQISETATASKAMIADANSYLASLQLNKSKLRYTTWFGEISSLRYKYVVSSFENMEDKATSLTYDCDSCLNYFEIDYFETYAYVINPESKIIFLCARFWDEPADHVASQAGVIIHELSHISRIKTLDLAYGAGPARALLAEDPWLGVMNADNHMYFAENDPALS